MGHEEQDCVVTYASKTRGQRPADQHVNEFIGPEDLENMGEGAPPCVELGVNKVGDTATTTTSPKEPLDDPEHAAPAQRTHAPLIAKEREVAAAIVELVPRSIALPETTEEEKDTAKSQPSSLGTKECPEEKNAKVTPGNDTTAKRGKEKRAPKLPPDEELPQETNIPQRRRTRKENEREKATLPPLRPKDSGHSELEDPLFLAG